MDKALTIGRYLANAGGSVKSLMAEGATVAGRFPPRQEQFNNEMNEFLTPIRESLDRTEGGGFMYGGFTGGFWNDGAHGATTIKKDNPDLHYLHVLTPPSGSDLVLRDNGYQVARVTDLRTGEARAFSQAAGTLTITGVRAWDQFDTVFKVETTGRPGLVPVRASGDAAAAADGDFLTWWENGGMLPASISLDLGAATKVSGLAVNQREWSVSYRRSADEDSARVKEYRVYASSDGAEWGEPIRTGTLPSARGMQIIDLDTNSQHLCLEVTGAWASADRLGIDEIQVLGQPPAGTG